MTREEFMNEYESAADEMTREEFRRVFAAGRELLKDTFSDRELAEQLGAGATTIDRWLNGTSCPAPMARKVYIRKLIRRVITLEG